MIMLRKHISNEPLTVTFTISLTLLVFNTLGADVDSPQCIYIEEKCCPNISTTEVCKCRRVNEESVVCCHLKSDFELLEGLTCAEVGRRPEITAVHIRNATLEKLDAGHNQWRYLVSLSVTHSNVPRLVKSFGSDFKLTCLNFSNNGLSEMDPRVFKELPKLSKLDLSHNNLTQLPEINPLSINHFFLDIADNPHLLCHSLSELVTNYNNINFLHENATSCVQPTVFHWFNSTDRVTLQKIKMKTKVDKECPRGEGYTCSCDVFRFESIDGNSTYTLRVDCSNQKLTALPTLLPPYTVQLNVSYNNITTLDSLSREPSYENIRYLYAEYNQIESFKVLEGSRFMDHFIHLGLKHNSIKTLPIYILSNAVDRLNQFNSDKSISLGKNRLNCDCSTALIVKYWLNNNKKVVKDYDDIWCDNIKDTKVVDLDQKKLCVYQKDWSYYIHYIIAIEILLFILLISKVSYDYWVFKTAGYLPWPASKMPKLPCDWVFE